MIIKFTQKCIFCRLCVYALMYTGICHSAVFRPVSQFICANIILPRYTCSLKLFCILFTAFCVFFIFCTLHFAYIIFFDILLAGESRETNAQNHQQQFVSELVTVMKGRIDATDSGSKNMDILSNA